MSLQPGTRLGPYEISAQIGVGGMGELYRARDTRLKRDVAIKILPESFAADPDRACANSSRTSKTACSALKPSSVAPVRGQFALCRAGRRRSHNGSSN